MGSIVSRAASPIGGASGVGNGEEVAVRIGNDRWLKACLVASVLVSSATAWGQQPGTGDPILLFDGTSLEGWKEVDYREAGKVEVADAAIRLGLGASMTGIHTTRKDLPRVDYELTYEAKRLEGNDFFAASTFPVGGSYVTFVNGGWGGTVTGISNINGASASENQTTTYFKYVNDTWYRFRIRVTGRKVVCWVDDKKVVDLDHEGLQLKTRAETRRTEPLGFANWETSSSLRSVAVRRLTEEEIAAANAEAEESEEN